LSLTAPQAPDTPDVTEDLTPDHTDDAFALTRSHAVPVLEAVPSMSEDDCDDAFLHFDWNSPRAEEALAIPLSKPELSAVILAESV
jgi:hypothetical protein